MVGWSSGRAACMLAVKSSRRGALSRSRTSLASSLLLQLKEAHHLAPQDRYGKVFNGSSFQRLGLNSKQCAPWLKSREEFSVKMPFSLGFIWTGGSTSSWESSQCYFSLSNKWCQDFTMRVSEFCTCIGVVFVDLRYVVGVACLVRVNTCQLGKPVQNYSLSLPLLVFSH